MHKIAYFIRPIRDEDIPQVSELDHESFPGERLFRSYTSYKQEVHNSLAHYIVACIKSEVNLQSEQENPIKISWGRRLFGYRQLMLTRKWHNHTYIREYIVGFAGLWAMLNEVHIIAIAVRNDYRQMGIGERLLISIIEMASQLDANVITLEVRVSNKIAQALYKKYGFQIVGTHSKYYSNNDEDATLMSTGDITSDQFQSCFRQLKETHKQKREGSFVQLV